MGLDMYLTASKHLYHDDKEAEAVGEALGFKERRAERVEFEAMYWRKAHAVHEWIVKNVQGGVDNCASYPISRERVEQLRALCQVAFERKDPDIMPPMEGEDADDWYWDRIEGTAEGLASALHDFPHPWIFRYQSSW